MGGEADNPIVLITTIDLAPGQSGLVELRKDDDVDDAARRFCVQHCLPDAVASPLAEHLKTSLVQAKVRTPIS
jgi:hypothetical protein